jgi:hypothetical protein
MASSNYGVILARETSSNSGSFTSIGQATSIDLPKYMTDAIESTNHSGSGLGEFITSGLVGVDTFSATYICGSAIISTIKTDMRAKTISLFRLSGMGDFNSIKFNAFFRSFQLLGADAKSPDMIKCTIEMRTTGSLVAA